MVETLTERLRRLAPFFVAGIICIIAGGLLAAATAYVTTQKTAWATAYLVLVGGVAQIGLAVGLAFVAHSVGRRTVWWAFLLWNLGNAGVLAGQLTSVFILTVIGSVALVAALVLIDVATRRRGAAPAHPVVLWGFRSLVLVLAVSIVVGLFLASLQI